MNHVDTNSEQGLNINSAITCILPMPQTVYTGDEDGRVVRQISTSRAKYISLTLIATSMSGTVYSGMNITLGASRSFFSEG